MMSKVEWDSDAYDKLSDPQFNWGMKLLSTVDLCGSETVLDAGCGTGRLAEELLKRLPRGKLILVDASENMVQKTREKFAGRPNAEIRHADLAELKLATQVDGVFSNAVFHWVPDHERMFQSLFELLKPKGWLVAQFGGGGNLRGLKDRVEKLRMEEPYASRLKDFDEVAHYEEVGPTIARMKVAGFTKIEARLHGDPVTFATADEFKKFVKKVNLHRYVARLPEELQGSFLEKLAEMAAGDAPPFTLDYVRMTVRAEKPE